MLNDEKNIKQDWSYVEVGDEYMKIILLFYFCMYL